MRRCHHAVTKTSIIGDTNIYICMVKYATGVSLRRRVVLLLPGLLPHRGWSSPRRLSQVEAAAAMHCSRSWLLRPRLVWWVSQTRRELLAAVDRHN